ncbi:MAG TPA: helix-turn-helix domain-containing protein [Erysipelothrix sp.]
MKSLLSYRDQRILKISELLILNKESLTYDDVMKVNACSLKTVYEDVAYLEKTWGHLLKISIENSTIKSENTSISDLMRLKQSIFRNTLALQIGMHLYFEGAKKMTQLIDLLHYSESKIRTEIRLLNELLAPLNIGIVLENGYYTIQTDNNFKAAYLVSLTILSSGLPMEIYEQRHILIAQSKIEERFSFKLPNLIKDEIALADMILAQKGLDNDLSNCRTKMPEAMRDFITEMWVITFGDDLELPEVYYDVFEIIYFKAHVFKENIFYMHRYNYFYRLFAQENKQAIKFYEEKMALLSAQWDVEMISYKEELLFMLYINVPTMRLYRKHKIAVHSDLGQEHAFVLLKRLKKYFFLHEFFIYEEEKHYDYIVTTSKWNLKTHCSEDKIVQVSDFITKQDCDALYERIYYK